MDMSVSWSPPPRQLMAYLALVPSEVAGKGSRQSRQRASEARHDPAGVAHPDVFRRKAHSRSGTAPGRLMPAKARGSR